MYDLGQDAPIYYFARGRVAGVFECDPSMLVLCRIDVVDAALRFRRDECAFRQDDGLKISSSGNRIERNVLGA